MSGALVATGASGRGTDAAGTPVPWPPGPDTAGDPERVVCDPRVQRGDPEA
jgi:hypothetical protein